MQNNSHRAHKIRKTKARQILATIKPDKSRHLKLAAKLYQHHYHRKDRNNLDKSAEGLFGE